MQDDLSQLLGIKYSPEQQQSLRELERRSNDRLRVQNLLDRDYSVAWDLAGSGGYFMVPGKSRDIGYGPGQAVHPRYIAFKFFKELADLVLGAELKAAVDKENEDRASRGVKRMDKTFETGEELTFVFTNKLKTNDPDKLMELLPKIILGIEEEWGMNAIAYTKPQDTIQWEKVDAIINRKVGATAPSTNPTPAPITNDDILAEVAA